MPHRSRAKCLLILATCVVFVAGCGGDSGGNANTDVPSGSAPTSTTDESNVPCDLDVPIASDAGIANHRVCEAVGLVAELQELNDPSLCPSFTEGDAQALCNELGARFPTITQVTRVTTVDVEPEAFGVEFPIEGDSYAVTAGQDSGASATYTVVKLDDPRGIYTNSVVASIEADDVEPSAGAQAAADVVLAYLQNGGCQYFSHDALEQQGGCDQSETIETFPSASVTPTPGSTCPPEPASLCSVDATLNGERVRFNLVLEGDEYKIDEIL